MKKNLFVFVMVSLVLAGAVWSQQQMTPEQQKAMEAYMKMGAANENHEFLKAFAGEWNAKTTAWMMPGAAPVVSELTITAEMILDGRFLMMHFNGTMFGMPYSGMQIIGFDNLQKKYITLWIDNTSTAYYFTAGTRQGNAIHDSGLWPDPATGGQVKVRSTTTLLGPDEYLNEQFMAGPDNKEFKSMEIRCQRKKK